MRDDMSKVVTERPRERHYLANRKTRLRIRRYDPEKDYADLPLRVSGSRNKHLVNAQSQGRSWYHRVKQFSDLIGPLERFLRSNVGRPWDDVYSEMKRTLDSRKVTGQHIFDHVKWEVELHPVVGEDGKIYESYPHYRERELLHGLYVDPRTGLLCRAERKRRNPRKEKTGPAVRISIDRSTHYIKQNGVWYIAELKDDYMIEESDAHLPIFKDHDSGRWRIVHKKQCNTRELKKAGLKNDRIV